jgi:glutathione S-transferase
MSRLILVSHHLCPYVQRAAIALQEKGVPFERIMVDLSNKPGWFTAISPLGKVPLLQVTQPGQPDAVLFESSVICEYIEETQPGPKLHPDDPLERAQYRAWMEFGSSILADIWGLETAQDEPTLQAKRHAVAAKFGRIEVVLSRGPYFGNDRFTLVDAVFAPIFRYFDLFDGITDLGVFTNSPKVHAWRAALTERPSVRDAVSSDYLDRLRAFLVHHRAHLLTHEAMAA